MQASKEVWGKIFGTINTRRKFLDHRLELAQHEWARLKANDSLECRNCHSSVAMDLSKQTERAAEIHTRYLLSGEATCIDCHKGIAHELPNMEGVDPGWKVPPELEGEGLPQSSAIEALERIAAMFFFFLVIWAKILTTRANNAGPRKSEGRGDGSYALGINSPARRRRLRGCRSRRNSARRRQPRSRPGSRRRQGCPPPRPRSSSSRRCRRRGPSR